MQVHPITLATSMAMLNSSDKRSLPSNSENDAATKSTGVTAGSPDAGESRISPTAPAESDTQAAMGGTAQLSAVDQLKSMIQALEKRLAQLQQQIARTSTQQSASSDNAARSTLQTLTAEASSVSSALQTAQAELAQAILASGKATGLLSAQA